MLGKLRIALPLLLVTTVSLQPHSVRAADNGDRIVEVIADPASIELSGQRASFSILVHGKTADGRFVDLTRDAKYISEHPDLASVDKRGVVHSRRDGGTGVRIEAAGLTVRVAVRTSDAEVPPSFNFEHDIVPLLSRFSCNYSGCHGKAEGQNGFKLSVFGFDTRADYQSLVMEGRGRRVFPADPDRSLLLQKMSGVVPHGGGVRIALGSRDYLTMHRWIASGMPFGEPTDPKVVSLRLSPKERVIALGARQQLRAVARYSDGREVDVTHLARFQSNNDQLASVDEHGLVAIGDVPGQAAVMASFMGAVDVFQVLIPRAEKIADYPALVENNFIDRLVHAKLRKLNIVPSEPGSDADFLRRAYLDIIGTLPTAEEARRFLTDERPNRRALLVDELLDRPEYADYWALKWSDLLQVNRLTLGHKGAYSYYKWIRDSVAENKPLDVMARELITAEGPLSESPQGQFYKVVTKPGEMASTLSQVFLGVRIACAQCHHHPFDRWSQTDYYGMQGFFQQVRSKQSPRGEVVFADGDPQTKHPRTGAVVVPHLLGTTMPEEAPQGDRRRTLARQLTSPQNPWFARNFANRFVAHFLGRGLIEPVDDVRDTNPPSNPELLDALAAYLVEEKFDAKQLIRAITASQTYARSSRPNETNERDEQNYSRALFRRIPAEALLDAVCQTTGVEEKFDGVPAGYRAIQLWDSQVPHYFLRLFGRPVRATVCECERNSEPSIGQVLHLLNSPEIDRKIAHQSGTIARLVREIADNEKLVEEIYLTFYSRFPSDQERQDAAQYFQSASQGRRRAAEDLAWSLLNSLEFVFNH